jgi:hypothetical protein
MSDIEGGAMPFDEKFTWVSLVVSTVVAGVYVTMMLSQVGSVEVGHIAYQVPMIVAIAAMVLLTIAGTILMGVGTGIGIELTGKGNSNDIGRTDDRDREISRRGLLAGCVAASVGAVGALAITMLKADHFWIANALYLSFVASSLVSGITKLVAYRRGF